MRIRGARHGDGATRVLQPVKGFIGDRCLGRFSLHVCCETAALNHESFDDPVKNRAVVKTTFYITDKIHRRFRRGLGIEFEDNGPHAGIQLD